MLYHFFIRAGAVQKLVLIIISKIIDHFKVDEVFKVNTEHQCKSFAQEVFCLTHIYGD